MDAIQTAIDLMGSITALARAVEVSPQAVCFWRDKKRKVPADKCPLIERVTLGRVSCETLRPDVDWAFIRGTAAIASKEMAESPVATAQPATQTVAPAA